MYKKTFGLRAQIKFFRAADYYEFLGYLSKGDGTTKIIWEDNDAAGAWAPEGRIHFYVVPPKRLQANVRHTAGRGNVVSRVNCNEFILHIAEHHNFVLDGSQDLSMIRASIPASHLMDFNRGLNL